MTTKPFRRKCILSKVIEQNRERRNLHPGCSGVSGVGVSRVSLSLPEACVSCSMVPCLAASAPAPQEGRPGSSFRESRACAASSAAARPRDGGGPPASRARCCAASSRRGSPFSAPRTSPRRPYAEQLARDEREHFFSDLELPQRLEPFVRFARLAGSTPPY